MGRFHSVWSRLRRWKFDPSFFGVAPKHGSSRIQLCANGLKLFYGQYLAPGRDATITNMLVNFDYFCDFVDIFDDGLPVRGASLTSKIHERNRQNQNCT
ncbi:hypothetical protein TNCV_4983021 [Trichonephila clavipes]|uniref:Uncharacterized protein n=1 Tax=Trichonephila clavipes TaxID=2585209 RepID=A0A8X7BKZ0_TRICX|nr:hypothetical protein TNCV_4983021 [Trichonephila clavipes]